MLTLDEVKRLPVGKGVRVMGLVSNASYNALITEPMTAKSKETSLRLVTENGNLSNPMFKNYGKTWGIEKVN